MMVDFKDRDDQEMVKIQEQILSREAAHKLFIQFHGSFKSTDLSRTYPNEFTCTWSPITQGNDGHPGFEFPQKVTTSWDETKNRKA